MRRFKFKMALALTAITVLGVACSSGGSGGQASGGGGGRVIEVTMTDNKFSPASLNATAGETVLFKFTNKGSVPHDAFIGDSKAQDQHAKSMGQKKSSGNGLTLEPGKTAQFTYTFGQAGEVILGCHQPGHYEGGMRSVIAVA